MLQIDAELDSQCQGQVTHSYKQFANFGWQPNHLRLAVTVMLLRLLYNTLIFIALYNELKHVVLVPQALLAGGVQ